MSYLRVSIGSSDMNDHVYSYDDVAPGEADPTLARFSLAPDKVDVIPVLKEILAIDPHDQDSRLAVVRAGMDEDQ